MTEAEAKTKVCCGPLLVAVAIEMMKCAEPDHDLDRCIGSQCMAWRRTAETAAGYCGLAGPPTEYETRTRPETQP